MANRNSRVIRNINSAAKHRAVRTTGKYAVKGIEKTARWMATDHLNTALSCNLMASKHTMNYSIAGIRLCSRRMTRGLDQLNKQLNTGIQTTAYEVFSGWVADHIIYVLDLLWGFIGPILSLIFWSILQIVVIVLFNCIFFYGIYLLIIS